MRGREEELAHGVADELERTWSFKGGTSKLFLASSAERSLSVLSDRLPNVPRALALHYLPREPERLLRETGVQILHIKDAFLTDGTLKTICGLGIEIAVATVNDRKRAEMLLSNGVQTVITDYPDLLG